VINYKYWWGGKIMREFNVSGKVLFFILIGVIATSGVVFAYTIIGTSGMLAVPNYDNKIVAITTTSFVTAASDGYKEPEISSSTPSGSSSESTSGKSSGSSYSNKYPNNYDATAGVRASQRQDNLRVYLNSLNHH
jgi:hypothetical protein